MGLKYNPTTGQIESAPLVNVPGLANQIVDGQGLGIEQASAIIDANYPESVNIPVKNPDGEVGYVPRNQIKQAIQSGYEVIDAEQYKDAQLESQYGDSPLTATVLGAARGFSFGLSDLAAKSMGFEDKVREIMERNKAASLTGEVAGTVAGLFTPIGVGALVARGAAGTAAKIGARGLMKATTIGALEGTAAGIAQTITEQSLGSNRGVAESLVANVGMGAMLGGAMSGVFYGGAKAVTRLRSTAAKKGIEGADDVKRSIDEFLTGERAVPAEEIGKIKQAASDLGITPTRGMESGSRTFRKLEASLYESPTYFGRKVSNQIDDVFSQLGKETDKLFEDVTQKSALEIGDEIKTRLVNDIQHRYDPIQKIYKGLEADRGSILIGKDQLKRTAISLKRIIKDELLDTDHKKYITKLVDTIENVDEINALQLQEMISSTFDESASLFRAGKAKSGAVLGRARDTLKRLEERAISRSAIENAGNATRGKAYAKEVIGELREARKRYREFMEVLQDTGKATGVSKKSMSASVFLNKLDEMPSEKLLDKLIDFKDIRKMERFQNNFPDIFDDIMTFQKARLYAASTVHNKALNKTVFNFNSFFRAYDKMPQEARLMMFGQEGMKQFKNIRTVFDSLPPSANPSRTALEQQVQNIFSLSLQGVEAVRYGAYVGAPMIQEVVEKNQTRLSRGLKSFFSDKAKSAVLQSSAATALNVMAPEYKERIKKLSDMRNDPMWVMQQALEDTKGLAMIDPEIHNAVMNQSYEAVNFLYEKAPKQFDTKHMLDLDDDSNFSDFDVAKFSRYLKAVDDPLSIVDDLANDILTPEAVEAVETLFPNIMQNIKEQILDQAQKNRKNLTYNQKLQLSTLLGVPLTQSAEPDFIALMQQTELEDDGTQQQQQIKPTAKAMGDVKIGDRAQTRTLELTMR